MSKPPFLSARSNGTVYLWHVRFLHTRMNMQMWLQIWRMVDALVVVREVRGSSPWYQEPR